MAQRPRPNIPLGSPVEYNSLVIPLRQIITPPTPVVIEKPQTIIGKTKEQILYERNMPPTDLNFFILPEYFYEVLTENDEIVAISGHSDLPRTTVAITGHSDLPRTTINVCRNVFETNELKFLVEKNDTAIILLNNKRFRTISPEEIIISIGKYTFYYYLIKIKLELNLRPSNKLQSITVFKNIANLKNPPFKKIEFYLDDALPPIANILSFQNRFINKRLTFEIINYKNSYLNKDKIFEIRVNNNLLPVYNVTINENIFICSFNVEDLSLCSLCVKSVPNKITKNNSCCIKKITLIGYNSKGESSEDNIIY